MTGYATAEVDTLEKWRALVHPDDVHICEPRLRDLLANQDFFNVTATTEIYNLSLDCALPI